MKIEFGDVKNVNSNLDLEISIVDGARYATRFKDDYDTMKPILEQYDLPLMTQYTYEKMRRLFRVKHGYSKRKQSWINGGYHGLDRKSVV